MIGRIEFLLISTICVQTIFTQRILNGYKTNVLTNGLKDARLVASGWPYTTSVANVLPYAITLNRHVAYATALANELAFATPLANSLESATAMDNEIEIATPLAIESENTTPLAEAYLSNGLASDIVAGITNGGVFTVMSTSKQPTTGITVRSDKLVVEGPLAVSGQIPFLGIVALDGELPASGVGTVQYACGDGNVGIVREGAICNGQR